MNAFIAELRRLLSRRLLYVLFGIVVLGFLVAGVVAFVTSNPNAPSGAAVQTTVTDGDDDRFHLESMIDTAEEMSGLLILLSIVVGATAIGAEWPTRSITASLVFEPRRGVLLASKLASLLLVVFVGTILLQFLLLLSMSPAALVRGTTAGVDGAWWTDYVETVLRVGFLCAFGATLGLSIATVGRNTGAALGIFFLYFAILEALLRAWKPQWAPWLLGDNMVVVAAGEPDEFMVHSRGLLGAAVLLMVYGAVVYLGASSFFRRRDIA